MEELNWYKFTEDNDHEGERWNFYILLTNLEYKHLEELLDEYDDESYTLHSKVFTEDQVDILVENADDDGYMPSDIRIGRPEDSRILNLTVESLEDYDVLYKGQFWFK